MKADKSKGIDVVQLMVDTLTKEIDKQIISNIIEEHEREKIEVRKNKWNKVNGNSEQPVVKLLRLFTSNFKFADFGPNDNKNIICISFKNILDSIDVISLI